MDERKKYPNLPDDVSIQYCTKTSPMPIEIANNVLELKQLWVHGDAKETEISKEIDSDTMWLVCPNCTLHYSVFLGD